MDHFKECEACPEMVVVPAGKFVMGSPENELGSTANERPQHVVTIAKPFAVGRFTVTFDEWDSCVAAGACRYRPSDQGWGRAGRPVLGILWNDAKDYLRWLSRITGKSYRLLSEAEREYVTRAGTATAFWWGASFDPAQANSDAPTTVLVHSFAANPWGLYQVHGNVYDWVEDCWNDNYDGAPSDGSAWTAGNCDVHVLRGGAFSRKPQTLRSAARIWSGAPNRFIYMSVRVARTLAQ
jgi:formylglycine-generating enzyme required for sulfatase activity